MIRPATPDDMSQVIEVVVASRMFDEADRSFLEELFAGVFASQSDEGHTLLVDDREGVLRGMAYFQPMAAADRVWDLTMIAVRPHVQGHGVGSQLIAAVEHILRNRGERLLIVETSATGQYDLARAFYAQRGYTEEARIRDYWADGDDKVVFRKAL